MLILENQDDLIVKQYQWKRKFQTDLRQVNKEISKFGKDKLNNTQNTYVSLRRKKQFIF